MVYNLVLFVVLSIVRAYHFPSFAVLKLEMQSLTCPMYKHLYVNILLANRKVLLEKKQLQLNHIPKINKINMGFLEVNPEILEACSDKLKGIAVRRL